MFFLDLCQNLILFCGKFTFFLEPIALGTILFASTFLCTDILAEYYGSKKARTNIIIGFIGFLLYRNLSAFLPLFNIDENISESYIKSLINFDEKLYENYKTDFLTSNSKNKNYQIILEHLNKFNK